MVKNGEEVLEKILNERPDLIMLDLMLPKKDGFMVIEEIKKIKKLKIPRFLSSRTLVKSPTRTASSRSVQMGTSSKCAVQRRKWSIRQKVSYNKIGTLLSPDSYTQGVHYILLNGAILNGTMDERKKKILIIEDDEHVSKVYEIKFSKEGYDTIFVVNGEDGVEKIATEKPDLIILDLMVPKKDGFVILEEIKKNPELAKIPVLVLSNLGQQSDKDRAMSLGANEYLVKVSHSMQDRFNK